MNINDIFKTNYIKRWQIIETFKNQSIAEHMYNTTLLAYLIIKKLNIRLDINDKYDLIQYILMHDMAEIKIGDIPSTVEGIDKEKLNKEFWKDKKIRPGQLTTNLYHFYKLCDILESYIFIKKEGRKGKEKSNVIKHLRKKLDKQILICNKMFKRKLNYYQFI